MSFEDKRKMLFESLSSAEQCIKGTILEQKPKEKNYKPVVILRAESESIKRFQGKQSIFKKPQAPIQKCLKARRTPDYKVSIFSIKLIRL